MMDKKLVPLRSLLFQSAKYNWKRKEVISHHRSICRRNVQSLLHPAFVIHHVVSVSTP